MRVLLFGPDFNRKHEIGWRATTALSEGLTALGVEHRLMSRHDWHGEIADEICIVNGWIKQFIDNKTHTTRNDIIRAHQAAGIDVWCIERGFLLDRDEWSALSINGFGVSGGDFRAEGMPPDRWDKLGIELQPWREGGGYILLCCQVPWDAQVDGSDHIAWINHAVAKIREHTDRPIVLRGHPKAWRQRDPYAGVKADKPELPTTTFEDAMAGAHAVVCFNSNCAVGATIAGVPTFTGARCMADPIANRDWSCMDDPPKPDRRQWAWDLAYKQWNVEEFRQALPWLHLTREVGCAKTS